MKIHSLLFYLSLTFVLSEDIVINIDKINPGSGYIVNDNIITINNPNTYYIGIQSFNKSIIVNVSCTIFFTFSTLMNNNSTLTPLIIEENKEVTIFLRDKTTIIDSVLNKNNAIIYLKRGVKLKIENYNSGGGLILLQNSLYAIRGEESSILQTNCYLKIISTSNNSGGIFIPKTIFFEHNTKFYYKSISGNKPAIECEGQIWFGKGQFDIISLRGKGIVTKNILSVGEYEKDFCPKIKIISLSEGIEATGLDIFCGNINIESKGNGITIKNDNNEDVNCFTNLTSYIRLYDGIININSYNIGIYSSGDIFILNGILSVTINSYEQRDFINYEGVLKIEGGILLIYSNNSDNYFDMNLTQKSQKYIQHIESNSILSLYNNGKEMINIKLKKDIEYIYLNYPDDDNKYIVKINGIDITPTVRILITTNIDEILSRDTKINYNSSDNIIEKNKDEKLFENSSISNIDSDNIKAIKSDDLNHKEKKNLEQTSDIIEKEAQLDNDATNSYNRADERNKSQFIRISNILLLFYFIQF